MAKDKSKKKDKKSKSGMKTREAGYQADVPKGEKRESTDNYFDTVGLHKVRGLTGWKKDKHKTTLPLVGFTCRLIDSDNDTKEGIELFRSVVGDNNFRLAEQANLIDVLAECWCENKGKKSSEKNRQKFVNKLETLDRSMKKGGNDIAYSNVIKGLIFGVEIVQGSEIGDTGKYYNNYVYHVMDQED